MQKKFCLKDGKVILNSNSATVKHSGMAQYWEFYSKGEKLGRIGETVLLGSKREKDQGKMYSEMEGFITLNII